MSSMNSVAGLSKYITTLPTVGISIFTMIFISFISGTIDFLINPNNPLSILEKIVYGGSFGFGVFGISSILSGVIVEQWVSSMKGINLKLKHSMFLSLSNMVFLSFILIIGSASSLLFHGDFRINTILFGCVLIYAFSILVLWSTTSIGFLKSALISCFQPLLVICMLVVTVFLNNAANLPQLEFLTLLIKIVVANLIFILAIYSFIKVIESPLKKNLGVGLLDLLSLFIAHINEGSFSLEQLFEKMGEPITTLIGILSFRRLDGTIKALFLSPCVHPGPIGKIGGANMPTILSKRFNAFTLVAHGPSTHDFNPVSIKEIDKIEDAVKNGLEKIHYSNYGSKFIRYEEKKSKIGVQFFGDDALLLSTFAPYGSDDIEFGVGLSVLNESKNNPAIRDSIIVDCHNSFDEDSGRVLPGNPEVFQLLDTVSKIKKTIKEKGIRIGCGNHLMEDLDKNQGIGDSGVKVLVVDAGGEKTAYILYDSNNMKRGFREKILNSLKTEGINSVEVMTTDTHSVNTLSKGYNPIGLSEEDKIINYTKIAVKKAIEDLEDIEAGIKNERIIDIKTFGPNNSTELISTISSIVSVSKIIAPLIFVLAILFVFIWIFYLPII
ncbi:DUF2070 family protein [Methanobrevibacter curvatus]|uniref:DUF2070 domain-containing protein n=1 Tax=Methanobrevibacter curvatus TaxID=49547 RepID=A0A166B1A7_9EURY|nr:DUF2070 family protein [Methanobrevibacter curvatus]KZX12741.1 hypothetical protein MBCUR_09380 [Methanobrevibacter curvatus]